MSTPYNKVVVIQGFLSYKNKPCRDGCIPSPNDPNLVDCYKYHGKHDRRRFPLKIPMSIFQNEK